ncbi:25434_t:CDS:2, partial [Gigaspora margarita]
TSPNEGSKIRRESKPTSEATPTKQAIPRPSKPRLYETYSNATDQNSSVSSLAIFRSPGPSPNEDEDQPELPIGTRSKDNEKRPD